MASSELFGSDEITRDWVKYLPLYRAIVRDDWDTTLEIINKDADALTSRLHANGDTAFHFATQLQGNCKLLDNLLKKINPEELPRIRATGHNPLHRAAMVGNVEAAKLLVEKNPDLLFILDDENDLPIHNAVYGYHETTYLYLVNACKQYISPSHRDGCHNPFEGMCGAKLLCLLLIHGNLDVPTNNELRNIQKVPDIENQHANTATKCKSSFIYSVIHGIYMKFWEASVVRVSHIKHLQEDKRKHQKAVMVLKFILNEVGKLDNGSDVIAHYAPAIIKAATNDTPEAVDEIMEYFPQAVSAVSTCFWSRKHNITQLAVMNRCENLHNLLVHKCSVFHSLHLHRTSVDEEGNTLLHLAGKLAPTEKLNLVSGAALQMQRELQWFQAVEKYMRPSYKEDKNKNQETPFMMFRREHTNLRKEGEEWMKKTADSYTITAALIITIVFAAAITVPGGTNGENGKAIYASEPSFIIFAISDAISLFTSTTSLLLFLSILTTRYRDEDFLYKLPKRLIFGLAMLFLSVTSLMVAFSATLYLMFGDGRAWILIPVASLACLPIASFVTLQLPLLFDLIFSTYGQGIFDKTTKTKKTGKIE